VQSLTTAIDILNPKVGCGFQYDVVRMKFLDNVMKMVYLRKIWSLCKYMRRFAV